MAERIIDLAGWPRAETFRHFRGYQKPQYAITWFSLAAIWLAMTVLFLRRRRAPATPKVD